MILIHGDAVNGIPLADESIQCIVTSPPYWGLRDYNVDGQIGMEESPEAYVEKLVTVSRDLRRVLKPDGVMWIVVGDSYYGSWGDYGARNGGQRERNKGQWGRKGQAKSRPGSSRKHPFLKRKDLVGIPWRLALALQQDGWYLRSSNIWYKPNAIPENVAGNDRTSRCHEYVFQFSKSARYYFDGAAISEPLSSDPKSWGRHNGKYPGSAAQNPRPMFGPERGGRDGTDWGNGETRRKRSVWTVLTKPYPDGHFATYPEALIEPCVLSSSRPGDIVLDPFIGAGTTALSAIRNGRRCVGVDISGKYLSDARRRIETEIGLLLK